MSSEFSRLKKVLALVFSLGLMTSCTPGNSPEQSNSASNPNSPATSSPRLKVVATTTILCDIVQKVARETVDLTCLLKPGVDGHVYEPLPSDRKAIEDAKLIFYSGYDFEPSLIKLIQSTSNPAPKIAVAEKAVPKPLMGEEHHHHGDEHNEQPEQANEKAGEEENVADPHVWQNAANGAQMVAVVEANLSKAMPESASQYAQNAQSLKTELLEIHRWVQAQVATIPESARRLVTTHEAMGYYSNAYAIPVEGALQGISTEEKPTASRIKELVEEVKATGVPTIFAEVVVNPKLINTVAKEAQVKVSDRPLYTDSIGESGSEADSYPKMLIANTRTIVEGLNGKYVAFQAPANE